MVFFRKISDEKIVVSNERFPSSLDEIAVGDFLVTNDNGDDGGQMFICSWIQVIKKNSKGVTVEYDRNNEIKKMILKWDDNSRKGLKSKSHRKYFYSYVKKEDFIANIDDISIRAVNYWF